jgi:hypothetical protein
LLRRLLVSAKEALPPPEPTESLALLWKPEMVQEGKLEQVSTTRACVPKVDRRMMWTRRIWMIRDMARPWGFEALETEEWKLE